MAYNYTYFLEDGEFLGAILSLFANFATTGGLGLLAYVLRSWALYAIAKRRRLHNPWLAWVPVADLWLLGCISDQYQYVVKDKDTARRKILLWLNILSILLSVVLMAVGAGMIFSFISSPSVRMSEEALFSVILGVLARSLLLSLPLIAVSIALAVFRFMALYDVYRSCSPSNATLFIVLSILIRATEPFFLFFSREKDEGMPPRRPEPAAYQPVDPVYETPEPTYQPPQEPWEEA